MLKKLLFMLLPLSVCCGAELYVDANSPSGGNGTEKTPFNTIQQAADKVSPGDTVIIKPGVYFETVRLKKFGTADAPVTFKADKVKKRRVIVTAADKAIRNKDKKWVLHDKKTQTYWVKPDNANPPRVLYSEVDLFPYKSLQALMTFEVRKGVPGPRHGFFFQKSSGKLFVRLRPDGKYGSTNPNDHIMAVAATREAHLDVEKPDSRSYNFGLLGKVDQSLNVIIDGITFETPARSAVYVSGNDVTVRNCFFLGCMAGGVSGRYIGEEMSERVAQSSKNITVEQCEWHNFPIYDDVAELIDLVKSGKVKLAPKDQRMHYWVHKSPANGALFYYETGIIRNVGKNWKLKKCYVHDVFDGIANLNWAEDTVIEDNIFRKCIDNAVETENHSKNCHIRRNRCIDIFQSFSYQPIGGLPWAGPVYIYQNLVYRTPENIFKTGSSSTFKVGVVAKQANNRINKNKPELKSYDWINVTIPGLHIFNNTFIEPGIRLVGDLDGPHQKLKNVTFSNNIAVSSAASYNLRRPGDGGVKTYQYTNNDFAFTAQAYPLFPEIQKQVTRVPEKVLPGWKDNSFVPVKFKSAAKVEGMPQEFKYVGALQSADDKIAETAGVVEDNVPDTVPQAKPVVKKQAVKKAAAQGKNIRLEWNELDDTATPRELLLDKSKLAKTAGFNADDSFSVIAVSKDGNKTQLDVVQLDTPYENEALLRFNVPANTKELFLASAKGKSEVVCGEKVDNILAGILNSASLWKGKDITAAKSANGILLSAAKHGPVTSGAVAAVPASARGKAAVLELDVKSVSDLTYGTFIRVAQFDKNGKLLSESVTDPRWISHMRPAGVKSCYRAQGVIHPQAEKLRLEITLSTKDSPYDNFGRLIKNPREHLAKMEISRAAVRCAEKIVFPRYNDNNFPEGVSGKSGDHALRLHDSTAFTHVTTSHATYGEDKQIRNADEWFWPVDNGTVECFFKPENNSENVTLFDAANIRNSINGQYLKVRNSILTLTWNPKSSRGIFMVKDAKDKVHKGAFKMAMAKDKWNHVACQWSSTKGISVYLNGKKIFAKQCSVVPVDIKKVKYPSIWQPHNFSIGASVVVARGHKLRNAATPKFKGDIDLFRISSTLRYSGNFTPAKEFKCDRDTRALYDFNRSFSGVSGGGICRMLGTYDSIENILDSQIECGGEKIQYFPTSLPEGNDPDKVICRINYLELPQVEDVKAARKVVKKSFTMTPGESMKLALDKQPYMDYIEFEAGKETLRHPILINDGEIDCRSFGDIGKTLNSGNKNELEKMYRIFNFMIYASDYFTSHQVDFPAHSDTGVRATSMALTMLNIYCGFNCGPLNDMLANIFACSAGAPATRTFGFGHSFQQVFYGGKNRLYDLSAQRFFPTESLEEAASLEDAEFSPNVLRAIGTSTDPRRHTFGPDHYIRLTTKMKVLQEPGFQQRVAYDLRPGETMRIYFSNAGLFNDLQAYMNRGYFQHMRAVKHISEAGDSESVTVDFNDKMRNKGRLRVYQSQRVFPHYSNAYLRFEGKPAKTNPAFGKITADSFCYKVEMPYTITSAIYKATSGGKAVPLSISTDGAKTFHALPLDSNGAAVLDYEVRARHGYWVKVGKSIDSIDNFSAITAVMLNSRVQTGKLKQGVNNLKFDADSSQPVKVTLQYRENAGNIEISGDTYCGAIPGNERQLHLVEPGKSVTLDVKGASNAARVQTFGNISASYSNGKLTITAKESDTPFFSGLILDDNGRKKELTIISAKGARLATAVDGSFVPGKGTSFVEPSNERLQKSLAFNKTGDAATVKFAPLAGGKYNCWMLMRAANVGTRMPLLQLKAADGTVIEAVRTINHTTDLFKAQFGQKEFGRFRWDCAFKLAHGAFFYDVPKCYTLPEGCDNFKMTSIRPVKFEVAAMLLIPLPSREFQTQMAKILSGVNCEPWKAAADGIPSMKQ